MTLIPDVRSITEIQCRHCGEIRRVSTASVNRAIIEAASEQWVISSDSNGQYVVSCPDCHNAIVGRNVR